MSPSNLTIYIAGGRRTLPFLIFNVTYVAVALSEQYSPVGNKRLSRSRQQAVLLYTLNWPWRAKMLMIIIIEGPEGGGGSCGCAFSCMLPNRLALRVYRAIIIIIIITT